MKKISLFFILTLFTFSFSAKMETKYLQIKYSAKGILEEKKLQEHLKSNLKSTDSKTQEKFNDFISDFIFMDQTKTGDIYLSMTEKSFTIKRIFAAINRLKEDSKYYQFIAYNYEAIIEDLPSIVRKCKKVLFFKQCKNVKVNPSITQEERDQFIKKEIMSKVYNNGQVHLPTENYSEFYQIYQKLDFLKLLE
jgi:hypothetical protein